MEKYLTTEEVADIARTRPSTVRSWRATGKGPRWVRRGRRALYPETGVAEWLQGDAEPGGGAAA